MPRENLEQLALEKFHKLAQEYGYATFSKQGKDNRIIVYGNTYFQFGDLRVVTNNHHVVVEVESAGGITNLVKYWQCLEMESSHIDKPIVLFHIFKQATEADYGSHLALWDFMWQKMGKVLGEERMIAFCYTYQNLDDLDPIVAEFEKYLKPIPRTT